MSDKASTIGLPVWHFHHKDAIMEFLPEELGTRQAFIKSDKPPHEIETRLRLLKLVKGKLPRAVVAAWEKCRAALEKYDAALEKYRAAREKYNAAWEKCDAAQETYNAAREKYNAAWEKCGAAQETYNAAREKYNAAREKYNAAWEKCGAVLAEHADEINALHAAECPNCPWDAKQKTIFPQATKREIT